MLYGYKKDERMQIKNVFHFQNATANRKEERKKKKQIKKYTPIIEEGYSETQATVLDDASFITDLSPQFLFIDR